MLEMYDVELYCTGLIQAINHQKCSTLKHAFHNLVAGSEMIYVDVNSKAVPPFSKDVTIMLEAHALCIMLYKFNLKL